MTRRARGTGRAALAALLLPGLWLGVAHAAPTPGAEVFGRTCAVCHFTDTTDRKVGPGLSGLYRRERLPVSRDAVSDERIARQIRQGSGAMPPHRHLSEADVAALLDYLRRL